jgi:hypothetical protein
VVALVYNWSSGERSLITDPATNAENDQVALGSFTITGDRP